MFCLLDILDSWRDIDSIQEKEYEGGRWPSRQAYNDADADIYGLAAIWGLVLFCVFFGPFFIFPFIFHCFAQYNDVSSYTS